MRIEEQAEKSRGAPPIVETQRKRSEAESEEPPVEPIDPPVLDDELPQLPETD